MVLKSQNKCIRYDLTIANNLAKWAPVRCMIMMVNLSYLAPLVWGEQGGVVVVDRVRSSSLLSLGPGTQEIRSKTEVKCGS